MKCLSNTPKGHGAPMRLIKFTQWISMGPCGLVWLAGLLGPWLCKPTRAGGERVRWIWKSHTIDHSDHSPSLAICLPFFCQVCAQSSCSMFFSFSTWSCRWPRSYRLRQLSFKICQTCTRPAHLHPFASQVDKVKTTERHVHDARSCSTWNLLKSDALGILALQLFNPSWIRIVLFENRHVLAWSRSCFRAGWRDKQCGWEKRGSHTLSISKGAVGVRRWLNVMTVRDGMWLKTEKNCRFVSSRASQVLNLQNLVPGVHYRQKLQQIGKIWQVFRYV